MERFNGRWIHRHRNVAADAQPKPFPGVHSLRVQILAQCQLKGEKRERLVHSIGKPTPLFLKAASKILNSIRIQGGWLTLREFDRNGVIAEEMYDLPGIGGGRYSTKRVERLTRYYHSPWHNLSVLSWSEMMGPRRVIWSGKSRVVYVPTQWPRADRERYKSWLESNITS